MSAPPKQNKVCACLCSLSHQPVAAMRGSVVGRACGSVVTGKVGNGRQAQSVLGDWLSSNKVCKVVSVPSSKPGRQAGKGSH